MSDAANPTDSLAVKINWLARACVGAVVIEVNGNQDLDLTKKVYGPGKELEMPKEIYDGILEQRRMVTVAFRLPEWEGYQDVMHFDIATAIEGAVEIAEDAIGAATDEIHLPYGDGPHKEMIDAAFGSPCNEQMKLLLLAMAFHADSDWVCRAPLDFLAERAGLSQDRAEGLLAQLEAAGLIADVVEAPPHARIVRDPVSPTTEGL